MADPTQARTLPELIRAAAAAYGDDVAIFQGDDGVDGEPLSYAGLERESARLARALLARGVGKGSRVGFIAGNSPFFALCFAAIGRIGAVAVPISTMIRAGELVRVLRQSDIGGLIVQRRFLGYDYAQRLLEALPGLAVSQPDALRLNEAPFLRWIVSTGGDLPQGIAPMDSLLAPGDGISAALLAEVESEVATTDQLVEIYTSGSMALPKGVRHNHGPVLFRTHTLRQMLGRARGAEVAAQLPFFWVGGLMMYLLPVLSAGGRICCTARTLSNSRFAMGSVLTDEDLQLLSRQPKPWWGLGMSETLGPYSWGDDFRAPGYPVCAPMDHFAEGYDIRIAGEDGQPVADGEVGEMQVRGYPVTSGLHKIERDSYLTADGFYRTGDLCKREGTRVHFVGRDGDMVKTAGSNVSPAEVEMELQALPDVEAAYVVGLPDRERGALLVAALVAREGATLDFTAIEAALRQRLSAYKVPRGWAQIARDDVPLLHSNKVARREIAAMMAKRLGREI